MHGRNRQEYKDRLQDRTVTAGLAEKAQQWHTLIRQVKHLQQQGDNDNGTTILALTEKLLLVNPDPLYLWNARRVVWTTAATTTANDKDWFQTEINLTQAALQKNPKAYGPWFHRKWCLKEHCKQQEKHLLSKVYERELHLTSGFLSLDERNFHCWNYRRFVVSALLFLQYQPDVSNQAESATTPCFNGSWEQMIVDEDSDLVLKIIMGAQVAEKPSETEQRKPCSLINENTLFLLQQEWDFTTRKIQDNFSNFSAFHYRSKLFPMLQKCNSKDNDDFVKEELDLVMQAIFTEPDDQTAWWYHRFLLELCNDSAVLQEQVELLQGLQEEQQEGDEASKWVLLGLHTVMRKMGDDCKSQRLELLAQLEQMDPDRAQRYQNLKEEEEKS